MGNAAQKFEGARATLLASSNHSAVMLALRIMLLPWISLRTYSAHQTVSKRMTTVVCTVQWMIASRMHLEQSRQRAQRAQRAPRVLGAQQAQEGRQDLAAPK